jgi:integrase
MSTAQPIRSKHEVRELATYYLKRGQIRNHILIVVGLYTALRISDLLRLKWEDVYDFSRGCVRATISIVERKTRKAKVIALNQAAVSALTMFAAMSAREGRPLIENPRTGNAISRIQAYRLIRAASEALMLKNRASCHSLRKTLGYEAWKSGVSVAVIMEIYNHTSYSVTRRYLGVTRDDTDAVYMGLSFVS